MTDTATVVERQARRRALALSVIGGVIAGAAMLTLAFWSLVLLVGDHSGEPVPLSARLTDLAVFSVPAAAGAAGTWLVARGRTGRGATRWLLVWPAIVGAMFLGSISG